MEWVWWPCLRLQEQRRPAGHYMAAGRACTLADLCLSGLGAGSRGRVLAAVNPSPGHRAQLSTPAALCSPAGRRVAQLCRGV